MTNKKAAIFHYPSTPQAALRTSRTSDRQPQRRTSQWTVNTLQTKQTAMTGASVGTMRTNMTMRCRAFWEKKPSCFLGKRCFFFWGGGCFAGERLKEQSNLRTLHCGRDDSCRSVFFFSVFFFKVAKWIFVWVLFSPPFFNAKFPFAFKIPLEDELVGGRKVTEFTLDPKPGPGHSLLRWPKLVQTLSGLAVLGCSRWGGLPEEL